MFTANKLESELSALKRRLGLTFIRFEDAAVELEPFVRAHAFDTAASLARHLLQHFKDVSMIFFVFSAVCEQCELYSGYSRVNRNDISVKSLRSPIFLSGGIQRPV